MRGHRPTNGMTFDLVNEGTKPSNKVARSGCRGHEPAGPQGVRNQVQRLMVKDASQLPGCALIVERWERSLAQDSSNA